MKSKNKFHGIMEKTNININSIDINDLSSLLIKSGYIEKFSFTEEQLDILNCSNIYYQILYENLEFNETITTQEITKKYGKVISSINKKFNIKSNFKEIFKQYVYYTKANISLNIFLNWLIVLDLILTNFNNLFNVSIHNLLEYKINLYNIDSIYEGINNDNQKIDRLDFIYENIKKQPQFLNKEVEKDLIIIIYVISLENEMIYNKEITNPINIFNLLELYNKLFVSNITISLLLFIDIIILINISIYYNKSNKIPFENINLEKKPHNIQKENLNNKRKSSVGNTNEINKYNLNKNEIPNFIVFDDEIILKKDIDESLKKSFLFQNCLKLFSLCHLNKNKIKLAINLSIQNIQELINKLNNSLKEEQIRQKEIEAKKLTQPNQNLFSSNNDFGENLKNYIKNNKLKSSRNTTNKIDNNINIKANISYKPSNLLSIKKEPYQNKYMENIKIMTQNNLYSCFNNCFIDELLIKIINTINSTNIKKINMNYLSLISNSNSCYYREAIINDKPDEETNKDESKINNEIIDSSIMFTPRTIRNSSQTQILKDSRENIIDNLSLKHFFSENEILNEFLDFYSHLDNKKIPKLIQIKLNTFKCNINQQNKSIQIFLNYSKIKEKILFEFLKEVKNMNIFIQKYLSIISSLKEFKLFQSMLRVSQTNFRSNQLNYIFNILTHKLVDYIEENNLNKIMIYETQLSNYNQNMKVYLRDSSLKKKNLIMNLKLILFKSIYLNKIRFIIEYLGDLVDQWELIVFSDNQKDIKLLKCFEDNKLFIFFLKEKEFNINKNLVSIINSKNNNVDGKNNDTKKANNLSLFHRKDNDNQKKEYEYLNLILYIKNSRQDYISIIKTLESFLSNPYLVFDFKTNLICDRIFFEENIINNNMMQNMQIIILNIIDDFFMVTKNLNFINKDNTNRNNKPTNKIGKLIVNEYYNFDFFIGDDFVGVVNNHLYDFTPDISNNYSNLIYDFLSVLSTCLEFIYFILKIKSIFILRFVYIIHTKDNCYYSLEIKNWNFFVKKILDYSSLFTVDIKNSKPLFCFLKNKKVNSNKKLDESLEDNFYDVFIRLFLNLNKVVKNQELNQEFFKKLHKNIFKDYLYNLVAFSYEAFVFFNDIFISNNYLNISNGEKFENCYIIPCEGFFDKKNYEKIINLIDLQKFEEDDNNNIMVKNIFIYNFGIDFNYWFKNKDNIFFGFSKVNYFIREYNNYVGNRIIYDNKKKKEFLKKKFQEKKINNEYINKYLNLVEQLQIGNYYLESEINNEEEEMTKIVIYNSHIDLYTSIIKDYAKEKIMIQTQKNELNNFQNEEKNIIDNNIIYNGIEENKSKKDCIIY